jgi:hypothetical protein
MLRNLVRVTAIAVVASSSVPAQGTATTPAIGQRVRVDFRRWESSSVYRQTTVDGRLVQLTSDSMAVQVDNRPRVGFAYRRGDTAHLGMRDAERVRVWSGVGRRTGQGGFWGLIVGAGAGAVVGFGGQALMGASGNINAEGAAFGAIILGFLGTFVGALIGSANYDLWVDVPLRHSSDRAHGSGWAARRVDRTMS